jgi:tetrahydromethanopterin S-methyltransferase subunit D
MVGPVVLALLAVVVLLSLVMAEMEIHRVPVGVARVVRAVVAQVATNTVVLGILHTLQ